MVTWSRLLHRSLKSRGSATSVLTDSVGIAADLYIDDVRSSILVKKAVGAGSPIARRCAFVGHLRNAINTAAVIELFVSISAKYAGVSVSADAINSMTKCSATVTTFRVGRRRCRRFIAVQSDAHGEPDQPGWPGDVRYPRQTGSSWQSVKTARLTHTGSRAFDE